MKKMILGLDLGETSVGWGLLSHDNNNQINGIIDAGVRIFEPTMSFDKKGKAESKATYRRKKRATRRQLARHRKRMLKLRHYLQQYNMLPADENFGEDIISLDKKNLENLKKRNLVNLPATVSLPHVLPFYLRAMALDYNLSREELGRAIYHLGQRRGFLSNRKTNKSDEEKTGKVKSGIKSLVDEMREKNVRTLGELFAYTNPMQHRIRERYTSRRMYIDEFNLICEKQRVLISEEMQKDLFDIIFYQRPLKSTKHLLGNCELEKQYKRCSYNQMLAQEFRIYQNVNNLVIVFKDKTSRKLTAEERSIAVNILQGNTSDLSKGKITYSKLRKLLRFPANSKFSIELDNEKEMYGNEINYRLLNILGEKYQQLDDLELEKLLHVLRSFTNEDALRKHLSRNYNFAEEQLNQLSELTLPDKYCNLSKKAIEKLLPYLKDGISYSEAVKKVYPQVFSKEEQPIYDLLPSFMEITELKSLPNPVVKQIFGEIRSIVNAVIKKYGKPDFIRIELARNLKNSEKKRTQIIKDNSDREKERNRVRNIIIEDKTLGIIKPSNEDIEKYLLAEECNWICPYTGNSFEIGDILGPNPQMDIEHIIPYSRSLDNSFANKTLCLAKENRSVKKNYTPYEAYHNDPKTYNDILLRVKSFRGKEKLIQAKLRRFQMQSVEEFDGFTARMLNDTKIASKYAMKYLSLLYSGIYDKDGILRVQASSGTISSLLRAILNLNSLLGGEEKNRGDHRHHAIDAIAIAMSDSFIVKMVADYFSDEEAKFKANRFWKNLREAVRFPEWNNYYDDIADVIDNILVSHHVRKRVRGSLHDDTIYCKNINGKDKAKHVRVKIEDLTAGQIDKIADSKIRDIMIEYLKDKSETPYLTSKDGSVKIPIKKVSLTSNRETTTIGEGDNRREVVLGNNHHMEIVDVLNENGEVIKYEGYTVSMYEAYRRKKSGEPIVKKNFDEIQDGKKRKYRMSIYRGDIIKTVEEDGTEEFRVIRIVPQSLQLTYVNLAEARPQQDYKKYTAYPNTLIPKLKGKYIITPLGEERRNND